VTLPDWAVSLYTVVWLIIGVVIGIITPWAKLRWSKEYRDAKDERLKAKDDALAVKDERIKMLEERIAQLQASNPVVIRETYQCTIEEMKKLVEEKQNKLAQTESELDAAQRDLLEEKKRGELATDTIEKLELRIKNLSDESNKTRLEVEGVQDLITAAAPTMRDAYGPVGAWFLLFQSRRAAEPSRYKPDYKLLRHVEDYIGKLADTHKNNPEAFKAEIGKLETQAWEEFLESTVTHAIEWATDKSEDK